MARKRGLQRVHAQKIQTFPAGPCVAARPQKRCDETAARGENAARFGTEATQVVHVVEHIAKHKGERTSWKWNVVKIAGNHVHISRSRIQVDSESNRAERLESTHLAAKSCPEAKNCAALKCMDASNALRCDTLHLSHHLHLPSNIDQGYLRAHFRKLGLLPSHVCIEGSSLTLAL